MKQTLRRGPAHPATAFAPQQVASFIDVLDASRPYQARLRLIDLDGVAHRNGSIGILDARKGPVAAHPDKSHAPERRSQRG